MWVASLLTLVCLLCVFETLLYLDDFLDEEENLMDMSVVGTAALLCISYVAFADKVKLFHHLSNFSFSESNN